MFASIQRLLPSSVAPRAQHLVHHPYFVPRNSRGNLPVYTDIRNAGTRYLVLVHNIDGNANSLARDLQTSLFERSSHESQRMNVEVVRGKNLIITGGRWKHHIVKWLKAKGF
ncbi:Ribosomal protein L49/IMG2 [Amanita muscaria]